MKPLKLERHLQQKYPEHMEKDLTFFQRQKLYLKRQNQDASGYFCQQSTASVQASFDVALQIVKHKKASYSRRKAYKALRFERGEVNFGRNN